MFKCAPESGAHAAPSAPARTTTIARTFSRTKVVGVL
jgi:hypothetical protein